MVADVGLSGWFAVPYRIISRGRDDLNAIDCRFIEPLFHRFLLSSKEVAGKLSGSFWFTGSLRSTGPL